MPSRRKSSDPSLELRKQRAEKLAAAIKAVSEEFETDILFINSPLDGGVDTTLIRKVCAQKRRKNVFLILVTEGGSADCAFRIARCLQELYETFTVVVAGWCKSAGTLLCMGAYDLIMGDLGELGPLDVQVAKLDELAQFSSGLTIDSAFRGLQSVAFQMFETFLLDTVAKSQGRITTKTAAELSANMTVGLLAPVFQQMDPMKIGDDFRSTRIAEGYALRLDGHAHNLIHDEDGDAIEALVRGYPSHGFVIDRTEAQSLFHRVAPLEGALVDVIQALGDTSIMPVSSSRQQPIIQYLTKEVTDEEHAGRPADGAATGGKPPARKKPGEERGESESVSSNSPKGDGNIAVPLPGEQARASGQSKAPN
jgi:hypothetical protein